MTKFTKSISILLLSASLAVFAPGEFPSADNGYSLWAEAEAAKKGKVTRKKEVEKARYINKLRRDELRTIVDLNNTDASGEESLNEKLVVITSPDTNGPDSGPATAVDIFVSYIDALGNLADVETKKEPSIDWTITSVEIDGEIIPASGEIDLVVQYGKKEIEDTLIVSQVIGEDVLSQIGDSKLVATVTRLPDGSYTISAQGKPKTKKKKDTTSDSGGGLAITSVNRLGGSVFRNVSSGNYWAADIKGLRAGDLNGLTYFVDVTARDELGEVLDKSVNSGVLNEDEFGRTTDELGYIDVELTSDGELGLYVESQPVDPFASAALSVNLIAEDFGAELINTVDVPATPYREFSIDTLEFIESSNVIDMEYIFTAELYDEFGNSLAVGDLRPVIGSELIPGEPNNGIIIACCLFEEPFEGPSPDSYAVSAALVQNEDGETFSVYFGIEGDLARQIASIGLTLTPDDGGSDADPEEVELDDSVFVNIWDLTAPGGAEASELLEASDDVSYSFSLSSNGSLQDITAGLNKRRGNIVLSRRVLLEEAINERKRGPRYSYETIRRKAGKSASK